MTPLTSNLGCDRADLALLGRALYVALVALVVSTAIGYAASAGLLVPVAVPLGVVLVGAMAWLPHRVEHVGWAVLTIWLRASVYLGTGDAIEYAALAAVVLLSGAGVFASPWFLVAVWFLHPLWDLLPRDLPARMHDLPHACLLYDLVVAVYLLWRTRRGDFVGVGADPDAVTGWTAPTRRGAVARVGLALWPAVVVAVQATTIASVGSAAVAAITAPALAAFVVVAFARLPEPAYRLSWAVLTGWTAMTFAHSAAALEIVVFLVLLVVTIIGARSSLAALGGVWAFHALWSLVPREHGVTSSIMGHWLHWPWAGFVFEGLVAAYLLRQASRSGRGGEPPPG